MKVLITGGSGGIGRATAQLLIERGHQVTITYRNNKAAAAELEQAGAQIWHYDSADKSSRQAITKEIAVGGFDGLVNNEGAMGPRGPIEELDPEELTATVSAGVAAWFCVSQAFGKALMDRSARGAIVNVLSSYVLGIPPVQVSPYVILKTAQLGLTRALAAEFVRDGIRVNAVSPSMTRTGMVAELPERMVELIENGLPMHRIAEPTEVASVIAFLLSEEAAYINGANLPVTGGSLA